jgi:hypothetical protein
VRQATKKIVLKLNLVTFSNFLLFCYSAGFLCAQEKRIVFSFFLGICLVDEVRRCRTR